MGNSQGRPVVFTDEVQLDHFKLLRVVGKGAFGKVRIVERKDTGLTFALKYIRKDEIVRAESVRNILRERRMLEHLNHPFLCNLRYSFQDFEYLYLVVDLMNGGDLRFHITRKTFTEDAIRFWVAEIGCALRYIHSQGIVHRDVKPDNILLDSEGHVHLADFNVASDISQNRVLTSKSGTLAYLAPEVYAGHGYGSEVDWWSLGVTFYECIYGKRPFEGSTQEQLATRVMAAKPVYPLTAPPVSTTCSSAIQRLMTKSIPDRIGADDFRSFTQHPFFLPLDFKALEERKLQPVFVPPREKPNFDATYDLEELLLEEAPLEARARNQKPRQQLRPDATPQERRTAELHKMIEQYFEPFNYTMADARSSNLDTPAEAPAAVPAGATGGLPTPADVPSDPLLIPHNAGGTRSTPGSPDGSPPLSPCPGDSSTAFVALPPPVTEIGHAEATALRGSSRAPLRTRLSGRGKSATRAGEPAAEAIDKAGDKAGRSGKRGGSFLGFLSGKKARNSSPGSGKENGVLGKERARIVIGAPSMAGAGIGG